MSDMGHVTRTEAIDEASKWAVGLGMLTMVLAPLSLPIIALIAVALIPLLVPLLVGGWSAASSPSRSWRRGASGAAHAAEYLRVRGLARARAPRLPAGERVRAMTEAESKELYEELRPKAFGVAYRLLGSVSEAEDVVQEGFLRLHRELDEGEEIKIAEAYLVTVSPGSGSTSCARRGPVARSTWASGCPSRSSPPRRTTPPATPRSPSRSRSVSWSSSRRSPPRSAPSSSSARSSTTPTRGSPRSSARAPPPSPARDREPASASASANPASRPPASSAIGSSTASSTPSRRATSRRSRVCSPPTSPCAATAAARRRRSRGRSRAQHGRPHLRSFSRAAGASGRGLRMVEVNGEPGIVHLDGEGKLIRVIAVEIAGGQIQAVNSVVNPDKLRHLGRDRRPPRQRGLADTGTDRLIRQ